MHALTPLGPKSSQSGKGLFVTCRKSFAIIVFIRLALLADGDKQQSGAAKTWKRIRTTFRGGEGTVVTFLK
jgi:hypothetical protein